MSAYESGAGGRKDDRPPGKLPAELIAFAARKESRARELAARHNAQLPSAVWAYFMAARQGNWPDVERLGEELRNASLPPGMPKPDPAVTSQVWSAIMEIWMAFAQFALGEPEYAFAFGRDIIRSIPPGSIYFGGTDAGRGLVTALCRSHETGDPFFTLTQNALADRGYLHYVRQIYGRAIFVPSDEDVQHALDEYQRDLERREKENKLIPGEEVKRVDGEIRCTNMIAVWTVNGALSKLIVDRNPDRQFFVEQSFPLQWAYSHLVPHGLIMEIHRQPLAVLPPKLVEQDLMFWSERIRQMLGDWLQKDTSISEVCEFVEKVFLRNDLAGFAGDPKYVASNPARDAFSKLRVSIAELYEWRARHDAGVAQQRRMAEAADFAFRQAFALDPGNPHCACRCMGHYLGEKRQEEAILVAETASKVVPENIQLRSLFQSLAQNLRKEQS